MAMLISRSNIASSRGAATTQPAPAKVISKQDQIIARTKDRVNSLRGWLAIIGVLCMALGTTVALMSSDPTAFFGAIGIGISLYILYCTISGSMYARAAFELLSD